MEKKKKKEWLPISPTTDHEEATTDECGCHRASEEQFTELICFPPRVRRPHKMHLQEDLPALCEPPNDHIPREIPASTTQLNWLAMKGTDTCFMQVVDGMLLCRKKTTGYSCDFMTKES